MKSNSYPLVIVLLICLMMNQASAQSITNREEIVNLTISRQGGKPGASRESIEIEANVESKKDKVTIKRSDSQGAEGSEVVWLDVESTKELWSKTRRVLQGFVPEPEEQLTSDFGECGIALSIKTTSTKSTVAYEWILPLKNGDEVTGIQQKWHELILSRTNKKTS